MTGFNFSTEGKSVVEKWSEFVQGKTVVVTGASEGGLGANTAIALAHGKPHTLILLARSEGKVSNVINSIKQISPMTAASFVRIELDDFDTVRQAASAILAQAEKIDILINNAGVMAIPWEKNKDGIEKTFAINHLGHFLLTKLLLPLMIKAGPGSRIVNLTSAGYKMGPFRVDDWNFSVSNAISTIVESTLAHTEGIQDGQTYHPLTSYAQSKTANILFTAALAERSAKYGIAAFAAHPGYIPGTSLTSHIPSLDPQEMDRVSRESTGEPFGPDEPKSPEQGTATTLVAALSPDLVTRSGSYVADCQIEPVREYAKSPEIASRLWKLSEELVGEMFEL
ncbi:hypothetical protein ASPVEDRAFT_84462 [Aspergillus versicolor CBS 583.65]|uniref:Ketoreductase (KR) domain-containing protein n=1 Tax=Aspergillus versicolor CBS 583.65 TaxID=1036611 RepID=A0A1L9PN90_ASPVE|nr:uncharacterized protein ASPVEDRAFT_84462 [Aspergillus versicolor CBS 583.65]OJJ02994.1 hypothetical protein ASPVEDRAFT_84462 [Aspergillus versicolor CBS 583.65]